MAGKSNLLQRTAVSDTNLKSGRYARLGTGAAAGVFAQVEVDTGLTGGSGTLRGGVFVRYVDTRNWLMLVRAGWAGVVGTRPSWALIKCKADAETALASGSYSSSGSLAPLGVLALPNGTCQVFVIDMDTPVYATPADADLATGGTLASGGYGVYDAYTAASALTRLYDNFAAIAPARDAAIYASQSAVLSTQGMFREDSTGTAYGPMSKVLGDLPRIPVSGYERRSVEMLLKTSRGDFDLVADTGVDDISAQISYRPSWLFAPGA